MHHKTSLARISIREKHIVLTFNCKYSQNCFKYTIHSSKNSKTSKLTKQANALLIGAAIT